MNRSWGWRRKGLILLVLVPCSFGDVVPMVRGDQGAGQASQQAAADTAPSDPYRQAVRYLEEAKVLIEKEQFQRAVDLLRKSVVLAPQDGAIHHHLGYALWGLRQFGPAAGEFETALRLDSSNFYARYYRARIAYAQGELDRAIRLYEEVAASEAPVFDTLRRLSQAYLRKGETTQALRITREAVRHAPWDGSLRFQLAKIYQAQNLPREAQQEFDAAERLKRADQDSVKKLLTLSEAIRKQDIHEVPRLRGELLELSSQDPEILTPLGLLLGRGGLYGESVEPFQRAVAANPASFEAHYNLGLTLSRLDRGMQAVPSLKRAVELRPGSFEANSILGVLYVSQNRNPEAIARLRAANRLRPKNLKVLGLLGQEYIKGRYFQEAAESFRQLVRFEPQQVEWRYLFIHALNAGRKYQEALEVAQQTAERFPSEARSHLEVGLQFCNLGHYQDAFPYVEKAIAVDPFYVKAYNVLGDLEFRQGEYESSLASFRRAATLDPQDADARKGVAESLMRLKSYPEALGELQSAVRLPRRTAKLYLLLSQVHTRLGNREAAAHNAKVFNRLHREEQQLRDQATSRRFVPHESSAAR